jgi:hypothetical protein
MLQGCFSQSMVVSTVYATLGADAVKDAVHEGNIYGMLCNREFSNESLSHDIVMHATKVP